MSDKDIIAILAIVVALMAFFGFIWSITANLRLDELERCKRDGQQATTKEGQSAK